MTLDLTTITREALGQLVVDDPGPGMQLATFAFARLRNQHVSEWRALIESPALEELRTRLHEDPYTRRGFLKPRGYPGDAVLVDYIYGLAPLPEQTTALGRAIYDWCSTESLAFTAVRDRCRRMASLIDDMATERTDLRVLAVACGHLREAQQSVAVVEGRIGELVALDQDAESLRVVAAGTRGMPVRTVEASVGDLLRGRFEDGLFDLIYATGLFDYLDARIGPALVADLARRLRPGGRLVVGNFLQMWEAAYIEAFMDWWLVYRTPEELRALAHGLGDGFTSDVVRDPWGVIGYLDVNRLPGTVR